MSTPTWTQMTRIFGRIGLLSFGGPAAQIALMHEELVHKRDWLSEQAYLRALSLCMLLPGPEAMQLATYAGWRLRGTAGGLLAGLLFVLPGAALIALLALLYAGYGQLPLVQAAFLGIKAAVIVVVFQALRKVAGKALTGPHARVLAVMSFVAVFVFALPFPLIILCAGLWGLRQSSGAQAPAAPAPARGHPARIIALWGSLWAAPLLGLWLLDEAFLLEVGLFFSKLAVVTFGGAYAVLAYMTQTVVTDLGWITTQQMIDALGLAETTPGPLILVTEFVALMAGYAQGGPVTAIAAGMLTLWVTFTPCFLWIFLAGPYLDRINGQPRLVAALAAITAAVVGVIANLTVWFALHVLFRDVMSAAFFGLPVPVWHSLDPAAVGLVALAALLMLGLRMGFVPAMTVLACTALCLSLIRGLPLSSRPESPMIQSVVTPEGYDMSRTIDYGNLMHDAMRSLIRNVLVDVAANGLPGAHHFFITFDTSHPDAELADWLSDRYPDEMTVVMQHWYDNLEVTNDGFSITLNFGDAPEPLYIPYDAIRTFVDPSVEFGLRFEQQDDENAKGKATAKNARLPQTKESELEVEEAPAKAAEIVSLDSFRKT